MNDVFIIIVCIFFMVIIWGFYFKMKIREGNDPNADNYTMPISFSGEGNNKTINVPKNIKSNENSLNFLNDTNINGTLNIQNGFIQNSLEVNNIKTKSFDTNSLIINGGKPNYGIQMGTVSDSKDSGKVNFEKSFSSDKVLVFTTVSYEGWDFLTTCRIFNTNRQGFEYKIYSAQQNKNLWDMNSFKTNFNFIPNNSTFNWIAFQTDAN